MATQPSGFTLQSVLSDAWNTARGTFERWVDHTLPEAEVALARETAAGEARLAAHQAPQAMAPAGLPGGDATLVVGAGLALVLLLLLLR